MIPQTNFTFEIDNLSEKKSDIQSHLFSSGGGCSWYVTVHPKGIFYCDHFSLFLYVASPKSLRPGWKRRASFCFVFYNQFGKVLHRTAEICQWFCAEFSAWGTGLPLTKLQDKGFLESKKLIITVQVKVYEVVHQGEVTGKEMLDINGFQVLYTQVRYVTLIFGRHEDIAVNFRPKNKGVKTAYMNLLIGLIERLCKPPQSFSETELSNAHSDLSELTEAGFKLDWLKTKLEEVSLERKKVIDDGLRIQELEERVKNMEHTLLKLKVELRRDKAKSAAAASKVLLFTDIL
ncbi:MATH domain and coiled-coil domain-containing protein [Cardamine amara subsp. amara]|uniref:MATH domain and coiled-coil domain-containing protein n=1 Tax=Cardamine amara subsp. amara TaxID=228776 RepID=A0ABD1AHQ5_CARAN